MSTSPSVRHIFFPKLWSFGEQAIVGVFLPVSASAASVTEIDLRLTDIWQGTATSHDTS